MLRRSPVQIPHREQQDASTRCLPAQRGREPTPCVQGDTPHRVPGPGLKIRRLPEQFVQFPDVQRPARLRTLRCVGLPGAVPHRHHVHLLPSVPPRSYRVGRELQPPCPCQLPGVLPGCLLQNHTHVVRQRRQDTSPPDLAGTPLLEGAAVGEGEAEPEPDERVGDAVHGLARAPGIPERNRDHALHKPKRLQAVQVGLRAGRGLGAEDGPRNLVMSRGPGA